MMIMVIFFLSRLHMDAAAIGKKSGRNYVRAVLEIRLDQRSPGQMVTIAH